MVGRIQPFYVKNDIVNHSDFFMTKAKTVDVVYEDGVFKPRGPVGLAEGEKAIVTFEKARGVITLGDIEELKVAFKSLPKSKISIKKIDELFIAK